RYEQKKQGKPTKVPYQPQYPKLKAANDKSSSWASYEVAVAAARGFDGIGFVLTETEFAAFDIDHCRDPETGEIHPWAQRLVERANSYSEITVSGTGLRIIGLSTGQHEHRKLPVADGVTCEVYRRATRYIVMTGNQFNDAGLSNIDEAINEVLVELDRSKKKKKPRRSNGEKKTLPQELRLNLDTPTEQPT